jgi:hypothetical protein
MLIILLLLWLSGIMGPGMLRWAVSPLDAMALPALRSRLDDRALSRSAVTSRPR